MARERSKERQQSQAVAPRQREQMSRQEPWHAHPLSPFGMMRRFSDEMDRMFEGFRLPGMARPNQWMAIEQFTPEVDIFERDAKLVVRADMPGMTKDDVHVDITDHALVIEGERKYEHEENEEGIYRSERSYGHFRREIPLPENVKTDNATATFRNGVLEITLDAPKDTNRRRIQVQGEESGSTPGQSAA